MTLIQITWRIDEYRKSCFVADADSAWQLWFTLRDHTDVLSVRLFSAVSGAELHPERGLAEVRCGLGGEFRL